MKKIITLIAVCLMYNGLHAQFQVIQGTIYDAQTKETLPGVAIYLNGTSIITTSDKDGNFRLPIEQFINTNLVFSHLSYESLIFEPPFDKLPKSFFLKEKVNTLQAAVVVADRISREEKMNIFREHFLGNTQAGRSCVILNEEDIRLHYDEKADKFTAYTLNPIFIENNYLGYLITYDLHEFAVQYVETLPDVIKPAHVTCIGVSSFLDINPHDLRMITRRNEIYIRSPAYFWKNLVANRLKEEKFRLYNQGKQIESNQYFTVEHLSSKNNVYINSRTLINRSYYGVKGPLFGVIRVVNNNKFSSEIVFLTNRFSIDEFGNIDAMDKVIFYGDMGDQRIGDMLPIDFKYFPTSRNTR